MSKLTISLAAVAITLVACGDGDDATDVSIEGAWARTSAPGQTDGAAYLTVEAGRDDTLVSVSVPASVAAAAEIHESVGDTATSSTDANDMSGDGHDMGEGPMVMREVEGGVVLPAGDAVEFAPGGYHVMLIDLAEPLAGGASFDLTLTFEHADPITISVPIAETEP